MLLFSFVSFFLERENGRWEREEGRGLGRERRGEREKKKHGLLVPLVYVLIPVCALKEGDKRNSSLESNGDNVLTELPCPCRCCMF